MPSPYLTVQSYLFRRLDRRDILSWYREMGFGGGVALYRSPELRTNERAVFLQSGGGVAHTFMSAFLYCTPPTCTALATTIAMPPKRSKRKELL